MFLFMEIPMEPDSGNEPVLPTPAIDELFALHVKNFIEAKPSHLRVMADSILQSIPALERWSRGRNLPHSLPLRVRIMDWIWNHNRDCKCPDIGAFLFYITKPE